MNDLDYSYGGGLITERGLRQMTRWGFVVLAVWAFALITWGVLWPAPYAQGWWLVLELFAFGRVVCAYEGIRLEFSNLYLMIQGGTQDIGFFLIIFPWFIRLHERATHVRFIGSILGSITRAAERNRQFVRGFGATGLFLFVFFPVSGTGTLIGSIVGYMLGLRMRLVLPLVIVAHLASVLFLLSFFGWLEPVLRSMDQGLAQYFAWILLAAIVLLGWLYGAVKNAYARWRDSLLPAGPLREYETSADAAE